MTEKTRKVGVIDGAALGVLEIRRSLADGKKWPLTVRTKFGSLMLNSEAAQDFILTHGQFDGVANTGNSPEKPESEPEKVMRVLSGVAEKTGAQITGHFSGTKPEKPEAPRQPKPASGGGFLSILDDF